MWLQVRTIMAEICLSHPPNSFDHRLTCSVLTEEISRIWSPMVFERFVFAFAVYLVVAVPCPGTWMEYHCHGIYPVPWSALWN